MTATKTQNGYSVVVTPTGYARPCHRCGGTGVFASFSHVENGACFHCHGERVENGKRYATEEDYEKHVDALAQARAKRAAKRDALLAQKEEEHRAQALAEDAKRKKEQEERQAELATYKHLDASVGDTVTVTGTVVVATTVDTQFGASRLIVVETPARETVKLFTTASWAWGVEREESVTVSGTVKSFDTYGDMPQTQLVRPKKI